MIINGFPGGEITFVKNGTGVLYTASWTLDSLIYSQNVTDAAITVLMDVDVIIADGSMPYAIMGACKTQTYTGGFTVKCTLKPTANLTITYIVRKVGI